MSGEWLPVLVVLGIGALVGLGFAWRLGRSSPPSSRAARADDELRLADLEQRRDDLYARLRVSGDEADRRVLEDQAARVLRELDALAGSLPAAPVGSRAAASEAAARPPSAAATSGHPMLVGFLGGAAMIGLIAVLIFYALRDAQPEASEGEAPVSAPTGEEHPTPPLPVEAQARLDALRQRVAADPTDIVARKQLALGLLVAEQFFEAFRIAEEILSGRPDDPDGLYVQGMVRMTMGQDDLALESLDRVLEQYPNHILALAGRGMVFMRRGDREAAVLVWERALEAAGGRHPDLEQLLAMARDPTHPLPGGPVPAQDTSGSVPPAGAPGAATPPLAADSFGVGIELAAGAVAPRGATLFVFLREAEQGPPAAVKRIQDPVFPLQVTLGPDDSMLGRPLPAAGAITVRLDTDGSASTRDESDLFAEVNARAGESVRVVLGD